MFDVEEFSGYAPLLRKIYPWNLISKAFRFLRCFWQIEPSDLIAFHAKRKNQIKLYHRLALTKIDENCENCPTDL